MSKNIDQVYTVKAITVNIGTDLMYWGQAPYGATNDAAMQFSDFSKQFVTSLFGVSGISITGSLPSLTIGLSNIPSLNLLGNSSGVTGAVGDVPFTTFLQTSNNLSELTATAATARANLGITSAATATPSAITSANDTNVTLTLGGTPSMAALQPVSFTVGWAGQLGVTRGGTGAGSFTANGVVISGSTTTSALSSLALTDGQIVIGSSTGAPAAASITAGANITVTPGHNTITIASTGGGGGVTSISAGTGIVCTPNPIVATGTISLAAGSALTSVNDANVTATLGGSPSSALLAATSITMGWTGVLSGTRGGTGVNNGASLLTYGGNVTFSGAFPFTATLTGTTNITYPTSGTLATTGQLPTPAAMTSVNDTNVTITLGGTPSSSLLQATSLTMGWAGQLSVVRGGTGASSFNINGVILSGSTTTSAQSAVTLSDGQIVIGSSIGAPTAASLTAGSGITITPGHNSITIASSGGTGLSWIDQTTSSATLAINSGYVCNNGGALITFTLPSTAAEGSIIEIAGNSAGGWKVAQPASVGIKLGNQASTVGTGGSIASSDPGDCVRLLCVVANTTWRALSGWGNITVV